MILAGDIGGTNTRLALLTQKEKGLALVTVEKRPSTSWSSLPALVKHFLNTHHRVLAGRDIKGAAFSLAAPINSHRIKLTNLDLELDLQTTRRDLNFIPRIKFYNDLEALASGVLEASPHDLFCLNPDTINKEKIPRPVNKAIIAPGTGLGEAFIVDEQTIVAGEGGHSDFAPQSETEILLWRFLYNKYGHVSYERVLSGQGLMNIYHFLQKVNDPQIRDSAVTNPETITQKALQGDCPLSENCLDIFVGVLGAEAGNMALRTLSFGGVYLGGGIAPQILPKLQGNTFLQAFKNKGRFSELMQSIPLYVVLNENLPLIGAARLLVESVKLKA